jgi:iron complex transport system substrate-binding protein
MIFKQIIFAILCTLSIVFFACDVDEKNKTRDVIKEQNATGFSIKNIGENYEIQVFNPWQNAIGVNYSYQLTRNKGDKGIHIPVKRIACMSTTHLGYIDAINEIESLVGLSGTQHVFNAKIEERIETGMISELGYSESIDKEKLISLKPDVLFAYVVSPAELQQLKQLESAGINVVLVGDYLEANPIGKMEWLRFFAAFFDKTELADSIIHSRTNHYKELQNRIPLDADLPGVILNLPWQGTWWMPGRDSFMAAFIKDAGGNYLFSEINGDESHPVDMELVYQKLQTADIWLNTGNITDMKSMYSIDHRISKLFKDTDIVCFNHNKRKTGDANDFYESAVVNPNLVLKDLMQIFHPELFNEIEFVYYQKLEQ